MSSTRAEPLNYRAWTLCVTTEISLGLVVWKSLHQNKREKKKERENLLLAIFFLPTTPSLSPTAEVRLLQQPPPGTCMGHENIPQSPVLLPFCKGTHHVGWDLSLGGKPGSCTRLVCSRIKFHKLVSANGIIAYLVCFLFTV